MPYVGDWLGEHPTHLKFPFDWKKPDFPTLHFAVTQSWGVSVALLALCSSGFRERGQLCNLRTLTSLTWESGTNSGCSGQLMYRL